MSTPQEDRKTWVDASNCDPPRTAREYAYVSITGPGSHEGITDLVEIRPSESGNVGDVNPANGRKYKALKWKVASGLDDTHPLDQHISSLLLTFGLKERQIRELWLDYDITLQCVGYYPDGQGPGVHFDREVIRQAAKLGMAIDCDFYCVGDDEAD